jgi:homoserine dehydrogenase
MKLALIGYGNVGRAFARLLEAQRRVFPFRIVAIRTLRHGSAFDEHGLSPDIQPGAIQSGAIQPGAQFQRSDESVEAFLDRARAEILVELTTLNPATGEPAISHIRAGFARGLHVVTANKGPIAHAYSALAEEARRARVEFRFESTVMDGAPVFNMVRNNLPGCRIRGFTGVLNSTTNIAIETMRAGRTLQEGIEEAQRIGIAEADASYDIDGWDAAAKTAALANVWMDARVTPLSVDRRGIGRLTPERLLSLKEQGKTVRLVSRARSTALGIRLRVRAEVMAESDVLATARETSSLLLLDTDLMGTVGMLEINPGVEQTAYGVFSDLVDIAKTL